MKLIMILLCLAISQASAKEVVYKTLPNSNTPDYRAAATVVENRKVYQTLPNSNVPDYTKPALVTKDGKVYQTQPNSNVPDYTKPSYKVVK